MGRARTDLTDCHLGAPGFGVSPFIYGATERSEIIGMRGKSKQSFEISVDINGVIDLELLTQTLQPNSIVAIQSANIETGVIQNIKAIAKAVVAQNAHLHIDTTASGARFVKPSYWSTLHFDARSWNGPSGVGVFALKMEHDGLIHFRTPDQLGLQIVFQFH